MNTTETLHTSTEEDLFTHSPISSSNELKPIICGTDFSEPARAAADVASAIARRLGAPLRLVHVAGGPLWPAAQLELDTEARRLHAMGVEVAATLLEGAADEMLARLAKECDALMLIVSSLGGKDPSHWLLGSVAERIAESAPVPTLVMRDAAPFTAWLSGERALKVFLGVDFTASADAAMDWVSDLRGCGECEVIAAFAGRTPQDASSLGTLSLIDGSPCSESALQYDLKTRVTRALGEEGVRILTQDGGDRTDAQLAELAAEEQADLVVIGTRQRNGLARLLERAVSGGIMRNAPMSIACVPAQSAQRMAVPSVAECRRVLVAVDVDKPHGFAAPYAYGICTKGGTVRLVHVVEPFRIPNPMMGGYYKDVPTRNQIARKVARSERALRALAPDDTQERAVSTEIEIVDRSDTAAAICDAAERFNADVVCIGSHTRPGLRAKALGSVSLAVLQQCRRPVLVVWPPTG